MNRNNEIEKWEYKNKPNSHTCIAIIFSILTILTEIVNCVLVFAERFGVFTTTLQFRTHMCAHDRMVSSLLTAHTHTKVRTYNFKITFRSVFNEQIDSNSLNKITKNSIESFD